MRMKKNNRYIYYNGGGKRRDYKDLMDLDLIKHGGALRLNKPRFNKGLTDIKREKYKRENLYYIYKKSGH